MDNQQNTKSLTPVIFRKFNKRDSGEVVALFPNAYDHIKPRRDTVLSYMHVGQHADASYYSMIHISKPANPDEYKDLAEELTRIGYNLKVIQRRRR
jgi:arabinogalactan endo-1,4-beta-galactosidase